MFTAPSKPKDLIPMIDAAGVRSSSSTEFMSEIVVPMFVNGTVVGELDIDSHFPAAFGAEDRILCEHAAKALGKWMEAHP